MSEDRFTAAVAGEVLAVAGARRQLLQSIVDVARAIFLARAASIALLDDAEASLRFEAVAGEGAQQLVGVAFPSGEGIAGVVAQTGEPAIIDDLSSDPRFARARAEQTGYVPDAMMVAPLLRDERTLGTLSVLDRGQTGRSSLQELQLLVAFADQAALAVDLGQAAVRARAVLEGGEDDLAAVSRLVSAVSGLDAERRAVATGLISALGELLERSSSSR
jgi:GAF domain-containing protein